MRSPDMSETAYESGAVPRDVTVQGETDNDALIECMEREFPDVPADRLMLVIEQAQEETGGSHNQEILKMQIRSILHR